jgi:hypothetical protein
MRARNFHFSTTTATTRTGTPCRLALGPDKSTRCTFDRREHFTLHRDDSRCTLGSILLRHHLHPAISHCSQIPTSPQSCQPLPRATARPPHNDTPRFQANLSISEHWLPNSFRGLLPTILIRRRPFLPSLNLARTITFHLYKLKSPFLYANFSSILRLASLCFCNSLPHFV